MAEFPNMEPSVPGNFLEMIHLPFLLFLFLQNSNFTDVEPLKQFLFILFVVFISADFILLSRKISSHRFFISAS